MSYGDHYHGIGNHTHQISYPIQTTQPIGINTINRIVEQFYSQPLTPRKEPEMTTLQKVAAERHEARERERIEAAYADFDQADYDSLPVNTVLLFDVTYQKDKTYTYAALHVNDAWYLTGSVCNGIKTEDFYAWLIERRVTTADVRVVS